MYRCPASVRGVILMTLTLASITLWRNTLRKVGL